MFETSCYAFGGRIRRFPKLNVNKVKIVYCILFSYLMEQRVCEESLGSNRLSLDTEDMHV